MLQSHVISEASFTFVSVREIMVLCPSSMLFKCKGFIHLYFDFVYISSELSLFPDMVT